MTNDTLKEIRKLVKETQNNLKDLQAILADYDIHMEYLYDNLIEQLYHTHGFAHGVFYERQKQKASTSE